MKQNIGLITTLLATMVLCGAGVTMAGDDDHEHGGLFSRWFSGAPAGTEKIDQQFYVEGCGSCHFPYQPGFLPARSWEKIMSSLEDHFGESAELPQEEAEPILNYLRENAAGQVNRGFSNKIMATLGNNPAPLRITETRYFRHEHDELTSKMVEDNPDVGSFSNCDTCHTQAMQGSFNEHQVRIPGYGRWDD